jgi:AhpD family alkylhydroperoxidase
MDDKTKMLIAVGASFASNCQPCLKTAVAEAKKAGVDKKELFEAIAICRVVRKGSMGKMDKFASALTGQDVASSTEECPLGTTENDIKEWVQEDDQCGCS